MGVKIVHMETDAVLWKGEGDSLRGANLEGTNLRGANLKGADLEGAKLEGANLRGANLVGANLRGANLLCADLEGANLEDANLLCADMLGADLWCADLSGANLWEANLEDAELLGANLTGANLTGANLEGANLREANLESANFRSANLSGANLRGACVKNTCFEDANMRGCRTSWFLDWFDVKKLSSVARLGATPRAALLGCADVGKEKLGCAPGTERKIPQASEMAGVLELREALKKLRGSAPADKLAQMELGLETLEQLNRVLPELRDEAVISKTKEEATLLEDAVRREVLTCQKKEEEARASLLWKEAEQVRLRLGLRLAAHTSETHLPATSLSLENGAASAAAYELVLSVAQAKDTERIVGDMMREGG